MSYIVKILTAEQLRKHLQVSDIWQGYVQTPAGVMLVKATDFGIYYIEFVDLQDITKITQVQTDKLLLVGTDFQIKVWQAALSIPSGQTHSYHDLATEIGHPKSYRAVANALGANHIAYYVPCHRILRKGGALGGYKWGVDKKIALLVSEGVVVADLEIV